MQTLPCRSPHFPSSTNSIRKGLSARRITHSRDTRCKDKGMEKGDVSDGYCDTHEARGGHFEYRIRKMELKCARLASSPSATPAGSFVIYLHIIL